FFRFLFGGRIIGGMDEESFPEIAIRLVDAYAVFSHPCLGLFAGIGGAGLPSCSTSPRLTPRRLAQALMPAPSSTRRRRRRTPPRNPPREKQDGPDAVCCPARCPPRCQLGQKRRLEGARSLQGSRLLHRKEVRGDQDFRVWQRSHGMLCGFAPLG